MNPMTAAALKIELRKVLINSEGNFSPIAMRLAWHASGTFTKSTGKGGSNGATMYVAVRVCVFTSRLMLVAEAMCARVRV